MKTIAKIYGMEVRRGKRKLVIEGKHLDMLEGHFRGYLPNMVFLDETVKEHVKRATKITMKVLCR